MDWDKVFKDFIIVLIIVLLSFSIVSILNPGGSITGWFSYEVPEKNAKVEDEVYDAIREAGEARVIIMLNDEPGSKAQDIRTQEGLKSRTAKIKKAQDEVLRGMNYTEIKDYKKKNRITGFFSKEERPDFVLKNRYNIINSMSGKVSSGGLKKLQDNPLVRSVVIDLPINATLAQSVPLIKANPVWAKQYQGINITGKGETVCIIDTGVDYTHTSLGGCSEEQFLAGTCSKVIGGWDFCGDIGSCGDSPEDPNPLDDEGHGTHVAGIVASTNPTYKGVAPDANIIAMKVLNASGAGFSSDIAAAIEWCAYNSSRYNISVISMSLGGGQYYTYCDDNINGNIARPAVNYAVSKDISVIAASGNNGWGDSIASPACLRNVTSVGSVYDQDVGGIIWGACTDYSTNTDKVVCSSNSDDILDILAPGALITSALLSGGFIEAGGTSMAAPHAAGAVTLMNQYSKMVGEHLTPKDITRILNASGKPITDSRNGLTRQRIDVLNAINSIMTLNESDNSLIKKGEGKIKFKDSVDLFQASVAFVIDKNYIYLNSSKYPEFNIPANLTFYDLPFKKMPLLFKDGAVCNPPSCNITSYNGDLNFMVAGFSNYTSGVNAELRTFNSHDLNPSVKNFVYEDTKFYANYTNITSGNNISTGECNITFKDGEYSMSFNASSGFYEATRTFSIADLYSYEINCSDAYFEPLGTTDSITLFPACTNRTGGITTIPDTVTDW